MNKETPTTLQILFFALAALYIYGLGLYTIQGVETYFAGNIVDVLFAIVGILLPIAFVYFGITLKSYLNPKRVRYLKALLFLMVILIVTNLVFGLMGVADKAAAAGAFIWSALDLFIVWVIYRNGMRLSYK